MMDLRNHFDQHFVQKTPNRIREAYHMNDITKLTIALALSLILSPAALLAQETQPQAPAEPEILEPENATQQEEETTAEQADPAAAANATLTIMQQRMEEMLSHWDKMNQATDPAERQKLMQEHRQQMMALNTALRNMTQQPDMRGHGRGRMMEQRMAGGSGKQMHHCKMGHMRAGKMGHGKKCPMMNKHSGMYHGRGSRMHHNNEGMMEAFRQLEKRVDLLQQTVEYLMED
ncbi:MAG: hypothetical protein V2J55_11440 [Candidatus Competibacteraceae bacterium]|jgi:hypothetical protein|nr:hypothetical protein [Candidatus Competibacteraceae bacterium]